MNQSKPFIALLCVLLLAAPGLYSQQLDDRAPKLETERAHWYSGFTANYRTRYVPPINISNSGRADSLIRSGILYLSLSDAIALALENNIDVEVSRYAYPLSDTALMSSKASNGAGVSYDPAITSTINWGHTANISTNSITAGGQAVNIGDTRVRNFGVQQGFMTGGTATLGFNNTSQTTNNANAIFLPQYSSGLSLQGNQPLLQGFGLAYNTRNIRIAKNNIRMTDYQFQQQLNTTLNTVISTYWNLVSAALAVGVAQQSLELSQKLLDDNKKQLEIGTMAPLDVQQADQQVATSETNLITAQTAVEQQEVALKNLLSRNGLGAANIADVHIIPTDRITVPDVEPIRPVQDMMATALDRRPELTQLRIQVENSKINLTGARNAMLPQLNLVGNVSNPGAGGPENTTPYINPVTNLPGTRPPANPSLVGGYGNILSQLFGVPNVNYQIGFTLNIPLRNRSAQAAYITQDLQLRQSELGIQKEVNQIRMDVQNALIAVKNARARYQSATKASALAEAVLDSEQKKYALGASTSYAVVQHQTDLANARQAEVAALSAYALAKLQLDQATGTILENNNVMLDEAKNGRLSKTPSRIPDVLPGPNGRAAAATPGISTPVATR
ncbi:MAG TPA: TolC family protein [Bryobacteraceae bacterium]|nr:TolC family protein [Bryobacteraceae bacterium]